MKEIFTLDKIFKLVIIFAVLLIAISVFYYHVYFIPQKEQIRLEQQKQEQRVKSEQQCRETGEKIYKGDVEKYKETGGYAFDPQYKFNTKLNKCLYSGGGFIGINFWERFVKDVLTNGNIIYTFNPDVTKSLNESQSKAIDEYWGKHKVLFEE
ncbi:hypothetical protein KKG24_00405 [Patescibacteria group bacterium]|nr:hypothetical protein [Patescibacteria group bacterium]